MGDVIIRIKGKPVSYGDSWEEGNYQVYGSVEIKDEAGVIHVIENLAVKKSIADDFNASMSAVQIVDGSKDRHLPWQELCLCNTRQEG